MSNEKSKKKLCANAGGSGVMAALAQVMLSHYGVLDGVDSLDLCDKDTQGDSFKTFSSMLSKQSDFLDLLPYVPRPITKYSLDTFQVMSNNFEIPSNEPYNLRALADGDDTLQLYLDLAFDSKAQKKPIREGNLRDPMVGSVELGILLEHFEDTPLYKHLSNAASQGGQDDMELIITGGINGGMGAAVIKPLLKTIRSKDEFKNLNIKLVLMGPYFQIPPKDGEQLEEDGEKIELGKSNEAFTRSADQLDDLAEMVKDQENITAYYIGMPKLDQTAEKFQYKHADRRKYHILDLMSALACFSTPNDGKLYYSTLRFTNIEWGDIFCGDKLRVAATSLMRLISLCITTLYPELLDYSQKKIARRDELLGKYYTNPRHRGNDCEQMALILKDWIAYSKYHLQFWMELQEYTRLSGYKPANLEDEQPLNFFNSTRLEALIDLADNPSIAHNHLRFNDLYKKSDDYEAEDMVWNDIKPKLKRNVNDQREPKETLKVMMKDIFEIIRLRTGNNVEEDK